MRWLILPLALLAQNALAASAGPVSPAELILRNGKVYTDPLSGPTEGRGKGPLWSQAISIRDGNILSIGRNDAVEKDRGPATRIIDLKGRVVVPGFNDLHANVITGGLAPSRLDLNGVTNTLQIQEKIMQYAAANPMRRWIFGYGWDESLLTDRKIPTKDDLDAAISDRPIMLWRADRHAAILNSKALDLLGISSSTPNPKNGEIVKRDKGALTGMLLEGAAFEAEGRADAPNADEIRDALLVAQAVAIRFGVTSLQGGLIRGEEEARVLESLHTEHKLKVRLGLWGSLENPQAFLALKEKYKHLPEEWLSFQGVTGAVDGVVDAHTAALEDPYADDPHSRGEPYFKQEKLNELVLTANRLGLPVTLHATGDRAVSMAVNSFTAAKRQLFNSRLRNRVEHIEVTPPFVYEKFSDARIVAGLQPAHLAAASEARNELEARLGTERAKEAFALHSFIAARAPIAFGTDWPAESMNPMKGLFAAVFRQNLDGKPLKGIQPSQKLTLEEAIDAYTLGPAFATREEHVKGSLREGKYADIVVLDTDPFKAKGKELLGVQVYLTIVGGKIAYDGTTPELKAGR